MPSHKHPAYVYASVLEPWTKLALGTPAVIGLRLSLLPWMWLYDPVKANRETQRMFSEKNDAWQETSVAMSQAGLTLWFNALSACMSRDPFGAFSRAVINSSHNVARPSNRRVSANRQRLSRG